MDVQRCATTQREVSSAAAFYQAMRSQRTVPTVLVCKIAEVWNCLFEQLVQFFREFLYLQRMYLPQ